MTIKELEALKAHIIETRKESQQNYNPAADPAIQEIDERIAKLATAAKKVAKEAPAE
jgi:hypothetical protein